MTTKDFLNIKLPALVSKNNEKFIVYEKIESELVDVWKKSHRYEDLILIKDDYNQERDIRDEIFDEL